MSPAELETWLATDESRAAGDHGEGRGVDGAPVGPADRRASAQAEGPLTEADLDHTRKVTGYVQRHLAQRPRGDVRETPCRYSLMNWGRTPSSSGTAPAPE